MVIQYKTYLALATKGGSYIYADSELWIEMMYPNFQQKFEFSAQYEFNWNQILWELQKTFFVILLFLKKISLKRNKA